MNVEIFAFCEAADLSGTTEGKLNLNGIFDRISTRIMPYRHENFLLAIRIRFDPIESGYHEYRIDLVDADGRLLEPSRIGTFPRNCWSEAAFLVSNVFIPFRGIVFPQPGDYEARMAVNGHLSACAPLQLKTYPEISRL